MQPSSTYALTGIVEAGMVCGLLEIVPTKFDFSVEVQCGGGAARENRGASPAEHT